MFFLLSNSPYCFQFSKIIQTLPSACVDPCSRALKLFMYLFRARKLSDIKAGGEAPSYAACEEKEMARGKKRRRVHRIQGRGKVKSCKHTRNKLICSTAWLRAEKASFISMTQR